MPPYAPTRRGFLSGLAAFGLALPTLNQSAIAASALPIRSTSERWLYVTRQASGERINACWAVGNELYVPGYNELCAIMRDAHVDPVEGVRQINLDLIQLLYRVQQHAWFNIAAEERRTGRRAYYPPVNVHSGFRTWKTNVEVGGVMNSAHLAGRAADFHIAEYPLRLAHDFLDRDALTGGLGFYPRSGGEDQGWIHVDTGSSGRRWVG